MGNVSLNGKTVLVTGAAGFIGSNLVKRLLKDCPGISVIGIDNMNDYYDVGLKEARLAELSVQKAFTFERGSIADKASVAGIFNTYKPSVVGNLAAQAGVR